MGLRNELRRLRARVAGTPGVIVLANGSRHRFDYEAIRIAMFGHAAACMRADYERRPRPEPLPIYEAICKARDRHVTVTRFFPSWESQAAFCPYDLAVLVEEGRLEPKPFAPGYPPTEAA